MQRRRGFTITELLVAMALIMFIMAVLSEAFVAGLNSFRQLKSVGDMDQRLRTAASLLRRDLDANVLQVSKNSYKKISELETRSPTSGFFAIGGDDGGGWIQQPVSDVSSTYPPSPPYTYTLTLMTNPPPSHQSSLQVGAPIVLFGPPGTDSVWVTIKSISGNTITVTSTDQLAASSLTQFIGAQWDFQNGKYDNPTSGFVPDADGLFSPFATTFKLHFSIDLGAPPKGNGNTPRRQRRENFVAVAAPQTILTVNGKPDTGSAYSPFLFQNDDGSKTLGGSTPPPFIPPFEDPGNHLTQTAEVAYFLKDSGLKTPDGVQSLYTLYRRELALAPAVKGDSLNRKVKNGNPKNQITKPNGTQNHPWPTSYHGFSGIPDPNSGKALMRFNTHDDVSFPPNRCLTYPAFNLLGIPVGWSSSAFPALGDRGEPFDVKGSDILMTDVLSFSVRVLPNPTPVFDSQGNPIVDPFLFPGSGYQDASHNKWSIYGQYDTFYTTGFDKWNNPPNGIAPPFKFAGVKALEVVLRVYDQKTQRTRQVTILQPM